MFKLFPMIIPYCCQSLRDGYAPAAFRGSQGKKDYQYIVKKLTTKNGNVMKKIDRIITEVMTEDQ